MPERRKWLLLFAAWLMALIASGGALFIGEIMGQAPCELCWYQRLFMFPLAILLGLALYRDDHAVWFYGLSFAAAGLLFAAYHSLLYFRIVPEPLRPCSVKGPSCSDAAMTIMGGLPIPLLAVFAFAFITGSLLLIMRTRA